MRAISCLLLVALLLVPAVAAADDGPAPAAKPDPKVPLYSIEFLMPSAESTPEGWTRGGTAPAGSPKEDPLYALSETCGLDMDSFYVEVGVLAQGSETVGYAMLDVDKHVWALRAKLDARAAEGGWLQRELGSPTRLLLVKGSAALAPKALDALTEHVIYRLAELAMDRIRGRSGSEAAGREAAVAYADAISAVAKGSGVAQAILGIVDWLESRPKQGEKEPNRKVEDVALASFEKALADGVRYPPKGSVRVFVAGQLGSILLARKEQSVLACAYARAGKIDKAFDMLEKAIETGKSLPPASWRQSYEHMKEKDPDMGPLRSDPRFQKLMEDNEPPQPKNPHGNMPPKDPHHGKAPNDPHHKKPPNDPHHKKSGE